MHGNWGQGKGTEKVEIHLSLIIDRPILREFDVNVSTEGLSSQSMWEEQNKECGREEDKERGERWFNIRIRIKKISVTKGPKEVER